MWAWQRRDVLTMMARAMPPWQSARRLAPARRFVRGGEPYNRQYAGPDGANRAVFERIKLTRP